MIEVTPHHNRKREKMVPVALRGATVMEGFRESLFDAANRSGVTPNEFVLQAAAEKLKSTGRSFSGLFSPGDLGRADAACTACHLGGSH